MSGAGYVHNYPSPTPGLHPSPHPSLTPPSLSAHTHSEKGPRTRQTYPPPKVAGTRHTNPLLWTDRHLWKHYLPTTTVAGGNNDPNLFFLRVGVSNCRNKNKSRFRTCTTTASHTLCIWCVFPNIIKWVLIWNGDSIRDGLFMFDRCDNNISIYRGLHGLITPNLSQFVSVS